jgi:cytochrome c-type biogenesis protein CcmH/NrfF
LQQNKVISALIRKTHLRLIDSNAQSEELSKDLEELMVMVKKNETISEDVTKLVAQMRNKVNKTLSED